MWLESPGSLIKNVLLLKFRYDCGIILLVCVTSVAICLAVIPVCSIFSLMLAFFALLGVNMGIIDTVANSVLIKLHAKKVAPRLQVCRSRFHLFVTHHPGDECSTLKRIDVTVMTCKLPDFKDFLK